MPTIIVLGSVNLDFVASVERLPIPGETVTGARLARFPGGKGANQALAARRLGAEVRLVACVGKDSAADEALALLRAGGVDLTACCADERAATGVALIAVAESGENQIVVAPGANRCLMPESLRLGEADALICQLEVPAPTIVSAASTFTGFFCVNLAPAMEIDASVIRRADLIVVNESEAAWYGSSLNACPGIVAKTSGVNGATLIQNGQVVATAKPPVVRAVDTTAAGDAFTAAMTLALVEGQSPRDALAFACAAGAAAATKMGAQTSLPTREEVVRLM